MSREWPEREADQLVQAALKVQAKVAGLEPLETLRAINGVAEVLPLIAEAVVEIAAKETKITQKAMAEALGVPESMLRGVRAR